MSRLFCYIIIIFLALVPQVGWSANLTAGDQLEEIARLRLYPGGQDEESIMVQEKVPIAFKKYSHRQIQKEVFQKLLDQKEKSQNSPSE